MLRFGICGMCQAQFSGDGVEPLVPGTKLRPPVGRMPAGERLRHFRFQDLDFQSQMQTASEASGNDDAFACGMGSMGFV